MDPSRFWKECDTALGHTVTIDNTRSQHQWHVGRPVEASYGRALALGAIAGLLGGGITRLVQRADLEPVFP